MAEEKIVYYGGAAYKIIADKGNRLQIQSVLQPKIIRTVFLYEVTGLKK